MITQPGSTKRPEILDYVLGLLREITADWDVGEISRITPLDHLGIESISLVYLIGEIQQHFNLQDRLFEKMRTAEIKIADLRVSDLVDLVEELSTSGFISVKGERK